MSEKRDQSLLGLVPWKSRKGAATARMLENVLQILKEWVGSGVVPALTQRAILYRLLPLGWSKSDEDHPLGDVLERARLGRRRPGPLARRCLGSRREGRRWLTGAGRSKHHVTQPTGRRSPATKRGNERHGLPSAGWQTVPGNLRSAL